MKKRYLFLLLVIPLFFFFNSNKKEEEPPHLKFSGEIMTKYIKDINSLYGVSCFGSGGGFLGEIRLFALAFAVKDKRYGIEESRELIVNAAERLLQDVNDCEEARPYLNHYPFTHKGAEISFSFFDNKGKPVNEEYVAHVSNSENGYVFYSKFDPIKKTHVNIHKEPYEEALRIVKE